MPPAPTQEFSFDRDVGAYASKYFDTIGNDSRLTHEQKVQLKGTLLGGVDDIQAQRLKLQEEKDQGVMRSLQMQGYQSDLEDARARRIQTQREAEAMVDVRDTVTQITGSKDHTPEQKRQLLAEAEMNHPLAGDPALGRMFGLGHEMLPKGGSTFTPGQTASYISKLAGRMHPEDLAAALQDPVTMGALLAEADAEEKENTEATKLRDRKDDEASVIRKGMMLKELRFAKDETLNEPSVWLDDDSTRDAEMIVKALGTSAEQKKFDELRTAPSDEERYALIRSIQRRELGARLGGESEAAAGSASRARSLIFGK